MKKANSTANFEKMVMQSLELIGTTDANGYYQFINNACIKLLGFEPHEVIGHHFSSFIHPEDVAATHTAMCDIIGKGHRKNFENRLRHKNGEIVPVRWSATWAEDEGLIYFTATDITEHIRYIDLLLESEKRYEALFDNNPDMVFVQDSQGYITEVNQQFCDIFEVNKEQILGLPISSVFPAESSSADAHYLQEALKGNTVRFDFTFEKNGQVRIYEKIKYPIVVHNAVLGVQTIAKDVTHFVRSMETIQRQTNKLNTIFESITDAFLMLDRDWNCLYLNGEAERLLQTNRHDVLGKNVWDFFHTERDGEFHKQYIRAFETGKPADFVAHYSITNSWFRIKAFPSTEGLSIYFDDVTDRVLSRFELEKLSQVARHTTNGVLITDPECRIVWVNDGFIKRTGFSMDEAIGHLPSQLLLNPKADSGPYDAVKERMLRGEPVAFEILNSTKHGEDVWFAVTVNPIYSKKGKLIKYITIQTDITERVMAQQELNKLSLVASKTKNGVIILDKECRVEWINAGFMKMYGYTLEEIKGKRPLQFLYKNEIDDATSAEIYAKLLKGEQVNLEMKSISKAGDEIQILLEITAILDRSGNLTGLIEAQTDITEQKSAENKLRKLAEDLYKQNRDLQQFTYIVSHNLRAPVANAQGLIKLLAISDKHSNDYDNILSYLDQSILHLDNVLKDLNTILSIRDTSEALMQEEVNLHTIIDQVVLSFQELIIESDCTIQNKISKNLNVRANKAYIYSLFHNLLSNSIKYRSNERSLEVKIQDFGNSAKGTLITFTDNGSGFDMHKAKGHIFRLYKRFHTDKKGRGIGLHLVKTHLDVMDGHIEVNSQVNKGTSFIIYLPKQHA